MASIDSQSVDKVALKVIMDKEKNRVLWAEAKKDFVDLLLSFLTLPLGTIARLVSQKSNIEPVRVGSLSSLYQSVADFEEELVLTKTCKEMLLFPRNSMETYCQALKLNIDETPMEYFFCGKWSCSGRDTGISLLTTFKNQKCSCGNVMAKTVSPESLISKNGFVKETVSFIIGDDLLVKPIAFGTIVNLLQKFGLQNIDSVEEHMVDISKKEVIDLLKLSLISKAPLADFILKKKHSSVYFNQRNQSEFVIGKQASNDQRNISVKVNIRKSTQEILFAEGDEDFANFLFSFLTFPLGGVLHMLQGSSSISCMDSLYKSLIELSPESFLCSNVLKDKLVNPQCFPKFELRNQLLPIGVSSLPVYYCHTYYNNYSVSVEFAKEKGCFKYPNTTYPENFVPFKLVDLKFSVSKQISPGEFATGPSLYMVTDDLVVTPMSSKSAFSVLSKSKVPLYDLEERVMKIGVKEGLSILKASLISTSALTNGLKHLISIVKEEK